MLIASYTNVLCANNEWSKFVICRIVAVVKHATKAVRESLGNLYKNYHTFAMCLMSLMVYALLDIIK